MCILIDEDEAYFSTEKVELPMCKIWKADISIRSAEGLRLEMLPFKSFTAVIPPLSTRLMKPNFHVSLSHRRSTTVSLLELKICRRSVR